jgi:hypothetical protein
MIDLRLPEGFRPADASELLYRLAGLWNQALVYVVIRAKPTMDCACPNLAARRDGE